MWYILPIVFSLAAGDNLFYNPRLFEGDLYLTPWQRKNIYKGHSYGASKLVSKRWPTHTIVYDLTPGLQNNWEAKTAIFAAISDFHQFTCLKFKRRTNEKAYIEFYDGAGCGAPLGFHNYRNRISLQGPGCWKKGTIMHEIMHNLGFYHEQSRPDRDKYVEIHLENLRSKDMADQFDKETYDSVDSLGSPYDYESLMHYHKDGFAKRGTITIRTRDPSYQDKIGQRVGFSVEDLKQIKKLYKCPDNFRTSAPVTAVPTTTTVLPTILGNCEDKLGQTCVDFETQGRCKSPSLLNYMRKNCPSSCQFCTQHCGLTWVKASSTNSGKAAAGSWPWVVAVYDGYTFLCSGTLMARNKVVTAGSCVPKSTRRLKVVIGNPNKDRIDYKQQSIYALKTQSYSSFAFITLKSNAKLNFKVNAACVTPKAVASGSNCVLAGWNKSSSYIQQLKFTANSNHVDPCSGSSSCAMHDGSAVFCPDAQGTWSVRAINIGKDQYQNMAGSAANWLQSNI